VIQASRRQSKPGLHSLRLKTLQGIKEKRPNKTSRGKDHSNAKTTGNPCVGKILREHDAWRLGCSNEEHRGRNLQEYFLTRKNSGSLLLDNFGDGRKMCSD
jgi:hypothetical protein